MDGRSITAWARRNITERRLAVAMVVAGTPTTLAGVAMYVLPGSGFPLLVIGLSLLITGLAMLGAARKSP
ncbi:hypothetical protein K7B10_39590 [Streptomyces flavotricini]|uniref:Uncharacterized protein n=1 Tax=Streptomyces flavotricini TaxID=66888 RepID=A0ABS8EHY3_9ACTN|nr:hypothetical protein [Streptomyces flavotricini]MCC0100752.1 hypothetical protein [Streptomyces flavotricini]